MALRKSLQPAHYQQLGMPFTTPVEVQGLTRPSLLGENSLLEQQFQLPQLTSEDINLLSANTRITAFASVYAGHQFGDYNPRLGDGRSAYIGALADSRKELWEVQLKGSGITPFSRLADGRATMAGCLREYLMSEHLAALGIPTTRSLAAIGSEERVIRKASSEPAAILVRVSPSFLRFGHCQYFFHNQQYRHLQQLLDFTLTHYYRDCGQAENPYAALLTQIVARTAALIAQWQAQGWCHGVMNTDNSSLLGLTMDYGPCAFMEAYNPRFSCNPADDFSRYAFDQQPDVGRWNLVRLANCFLPWLSPEELQSIVDEYPKLYHRCYQNLMAKKLGIESVTVDIQETLIEDWLSLLVTGRVDYTTSFRKLTDAQFSDPSPELYQSFHDQDAFGHWWNRYRQVLNKQPELKRRQTMAAHNPALILNASLMQKALTAAEQQDRDTINLILQALQHPFDEFPEISKLNS